MSPATAEKRLSLWAPGVHWVRVHWVPSLRIVASITFLTMLLSRVRLSALVPKTQVSATLWYVALGLGITFGGIVLSAWRWQRVLTVLGTHARIADLVLHSLAGQFVGNVLPSTIGGDILRVNRLTATTGSSATSFASVVLERLTGWLVLPALALVGLALNPSLLELGNASRIALLVAFGTLLLLALILTAAADHRLAGRFTNNEGWTRFIGAVHLGVDGLRRDPRTAAEVLGVATAYQLSMVLAAFCASQALGLHLGLAVILAFVPVVAIVQVLPISFSGLGVRESALVLFLGPLGIATSQAVALGLMIYAMTLVISLLGAPAFAAGNRARRRVVRTA